MKEPIKLIVSGETPSKKNSRITLRNGRTIPSKRYTEWHRNAVAELSGQWLEYGFGTIEREVRIYLHFFHSDNRRRDSDNGVSSIFDTLQDCGIISDDRWQIIRNFKVENSKSTIARCELEIMEIESDDTALKNLTDARGLP